MANEILVYVSAAPDLRQEREILSRAVTEVPVSLGWRIVQSPPGDERADLDAAAQADIHVLLLGSDIRAPVGLEWMAARRAGHWPVLFLKQGVLQTPAAQSFRRYIEEQAAWRPFRDGRDLRIQVLKLLAGHILERAQYYALSPPQLARLQGWRSQLEGPGGSQEEVVRGDVAAGGVVLSPERYVPSEGVLIRAPTDKRHQSQTGEVSE
jgi:hypothetical protein